jgi:large subunit ribosomal protein L14e
LDERLGKAVSSNAGRDKGRTYIVVGIVDEAYLMLSDGDKRKLEKPKKKKIKHLKITDVCFEEIRTKLEKHDKITNAELRRALKSLEVVDLTK